MCCCDVSSNSPGCYVRFSNPAVFVWYKTSKPGVGGSSPPGRTLIYVGNFRAATEFRFIRLKRARPAKMDGKKEKGVVLEPASHALCVLKVFIAKSLGERCFFLLDKPYCDNRHKQWRHDPGRSASQENGNAGKQGSHA